VKTHTRKKKEVITKELENNDVNLILRYNLLFTFLR